MSGLVLSTGLAASLIALGLMTPDVRPRVWRPAVALLVCLAVCLAVVQALDPERAAPLVHAVAAPG